MASEFIDQLAELSYDPFFVIDQERRVTHFNNPFSVMLGLRGAKRRQIEGTAIHELLELDATGEACVTDSLASDQNVRVQSAKAKLADGRELVLDISALPLRDEAGRVTGVLVLQRDVTDEQRLKERYNQERQDHLNERETLLKIISDRDAEIKKAKRQLGR